MSGEKLRAGKTGIGYVVEQKMEQNYDREEAAGTPQAVISWMNSICEGEHDPIPKPEGSEPEWKVFNTHIRDGVMLCKLINKLLKADGKSPIQFQKKVMSPFVAMTNIENFNKGCMDYGMAKEFTFQSGDLWELRKAGFFNVLNCLHSLGFVANGKNVQPEYKGELSKTVDRE
ncbi:transgelin-2-like isoform X1 [Ruditapes philippinarum]|uniref:transgelin-2-like isoform X1 n=1 Tax=Ruditapes philippinarum TaxID=129788 RepID=UPI00295B51F8|nr:transgelin-2-like isoform X1 [Ruditapes philippinarum]XP_060581378.1 transgelin-2-like isoform X1 [Ruditapes philippinarum]